MTTSISTSTLLENLKDQGAEQVCLGLFGTKGKATLKAFEGAIPDAWKWAAGVAYGNPDAAQKILKMKSIIAFQPEAIGFLRSLPVQSRIRLLKATTFKYRGQLADISPGHVRETGYLWSNIKNLPDLGRIRCWFSVHEQLSAAYVAELPDEDLPIPGDWGRVDGLCAIDGAWVLELPRRVATLKYYGEVLRNSVGGYGALIDVGWSVILAVREKGILTHCIEISGRTGAVQKFYRKANSEPDEAIKKGVLAALSQARLV